jgi:hypothetical protein
MAMGLQHQRTSCPEDTHSACVKVPMLGFFKLAAVCVLLG